MTEESYKDRFLSLRVPSQMESTSSRKGSRLRMTNHDNPAETKTNFGHNWREAVKRKLNEMIEQKIRENL